MVKYCFQAKICKMDGHSWCAFCIERLFFLVNHSVRLLFNAKKCVYRFGTKRWKYKSNHMNVQFRVGDIGFPINLTSEPVNKLRRCDEWQRDSANIHENTDYCSVYRHTLQWAIITAVRCTRCVCICNGNIIIVFINHRKFAIPSIHPLGNWCELTCLTFACSIV